MTRGRPLLILGAGGLGREVLEAVRQAVSHGAPWSIIGFLDDHPARQGSMIGGVPVLGPCSDAHEHADAALLMCIASPQTPDCRARLMERVDLDPSRFATIVHPSVALPTSCSIGEGSIVLANAVLTADVTIGRHVVVMPHATLTHDVRVADFATIAAGARIAGGVKIGEASYLGAGSLVRENLEVGARSVIGMGAVVTRSVPPDQLWVGVPASSTAPILPQMDLAAAHLESGSEIEAGIKRVIEHGMFVGGPEVKEFESAYAAASGVSHCVGVGNGTDALELALRARGIGFGDEVIIPAMTFAATAEAVLRTGATVAFADVAGDGLLDPHSVTAMIGPRTAAVIPVHLYGQMADLTALSQIADARGLVIVEDAAQAHGAVQDGVGPGVLYPAATSFYPGKNLGAYGDAGAVLTCDDAFAERCRRIANHGQAERYVHQEVGFNSRLDSMQAAVLLARLPALDRDNSRRRVAAERYAHLLRDVPEISLPTVREGNRHSWHQYVVGVQDRDGVRERMSARGVVTGVHYPRPLHVQPAFASSRRDHLAVSEELARTCLSLPMFPQITGEQQREVVRALRESL